MMRLCNRPADDPETKSVNDSPNTLPTESTFTDGINPESTSVLESAT